MHLQFSLEDDSPEVNIDIDEDSVNIEIKGLEEEITNSLDAIENTLNVINTLDTTRAHIKKFGITKEFLHLVNTNNSLGSAIGLMLPHYEDDSEVSDVEEVDIPEAEIVIEGLGEAVSKAKDKLLELLKWFREKWVKFWNWIIGNEKQKDEKVLAKVEEVKEAVEEVKKADKTNAEAVQEKATETLIKGYHTRDFIKKVAEAKPAINALNYLSINKDTGEAKVTGLEAINTFLAELEYSLDDEKNLTVNTTNQTFLPAKEEKDLLSLGWDVDTVNSTCETIKVNLKVGSLGVFNKKPLEDMINKAITDLQKGKSDLDLKQSNPEIFNQIKKMKDNLAVILSITKETIDCRSIIIDYIAMLCEKYLTIVTPLMENK